MDELEEIERELTAAASARPRDAAALVAALERAVALEVGRPGSFPLTELLADLSEAYEAAGRYSDALDAAERAIEAGIRTEPDPRCRLAELHLRFGHPELAHPIFDEVKIDTSDDVWLYNNAGLEYRYAEDFPRALDWLDEGLELAMRTGDPEQLVGQLSTIRQECLDALGGAEDDLQRRAVTYVRPARRPTGLRPSAPWSPDLTPTSKPLPAPAVPAETVVSLGFAWFPAGEFVTALERWPDLLESWGEADFGGYCRGLQRQMLRYAQEPEGGHRSIKVAPVVLSTYLPWCKERGEDPGSGPARAAYAAERVRGGAVDVVAWPPARNDRCWCGSGRKYKQCCGTVRLTADQA